MDWILALVSGYGFLVAIMYLLQPYLLYPGSGPRANPSAYGAADFKEVTIQTDDGLSLVHWFKEPADDNLPLILAFHGNAGHVGDRTDRMRYLTDLGFGLFQMEYRGYAGLPGKPSEEALKRDAEGVVQWLAKAGYPPERLIVYGESLGTGLAVWTASRHPVQAVILEAPYNSIAEVAQSKYWFLPAKWLLRDKWRSDQAIKRVKAPIFLFHGERDEVIPISQAHALYAGIEGKKDAAYFPNGYHMNLYDHGAAEDVLDFLERQRLLPAVTVTSDRQPTDAAK